MFDSPHPTAFFEPLIDSEHAAALNQRPLCYER
jgi:hypothetical protein